MNIRSRRMAVLAVLGAAVLGLAAGSAVAQSVLAPAGVAVDEGGDPAPALQADYPTNAAGQTYGSLSDAVAPEDEPDLILVVASNGAEGYVLKSTLDELTGANVSSPEEAVAWQLAQETATWDSISIPVFASDGVAIVGSFEVTRSVASPES